MKLYCKKCKNITTIDDIYYKINKYIYCCHDIMVPEIKLLSTLDAAKKLKVNVRTIRKYITNEKLQGILINNKLKIFF